MFLRMQDFDFCPNLIKFYLNFTQFISINPNLVKCFPNLPKFYPNFHKFCPNYLKKFAGECGRIVSSYAIVSLSV